MKLKVAIIAVDYDNQRSLKHKFVSRKDAFDLLSKRYWLTDVELKELETNLMISGRTKLGYFDFYLIEW